MMIPNDDQTSTSREAWPRLFLMAGFTAALATTFGKSATDLRSIGAQAAAALLTAALVLAVVPVAFVKTRGRSPRVQRISNNAELLALNIALISAGASSVHFAVITEHFKEWWGFGSFFLIAATAQLTWALLVVKRPSRMLFAVGAIGNLFIIVTWAMARSSGLPFGPEPWRPERIGLADVVTTSLEALLVVGATALVLRGEALSARRLGRAANIAWVIACVTLVVVALSLLSAIGAANGVIPSSG
jgi:hypothetical protein